MFVYHNQMEFDIIQEQKSLNNSQRKISNIISQIRGEKENVCCPVELSINHL